MHPAPFERTNLLTPSGSAETCCPDVAVGPVRALEVSNMVAVSGPHYTCATMLSPEGHPAPLLWLKQGQDQAAKSLRAQLQTRCLLSQLVARRQLI